MVCHWQSDGTLYFYCASCHVSISEKDLWNGIHKELHQRMEEHKNLKKLGEPGYQPSVSLVLRIQADKLQVVIRDNGVGIEETIKTKVFSPFFTTKPTAEAAGTGLYLSREVVLNHKGTIAIESEKDKYTEVTITLPIYS